WSRYVRAGGARRYGLAFALLALGLLAKPMLVTVPFVLLLLDVWPLGRTPLSPGAGQASPASFGRLLVEKLPLFGLAAASIVVTIAAQGAGGAFSDVAPLGDRLLNAIAAAGSYLRKTVWPSSLAVFYPYRVGSTSIATVAASLAVLLAGTFIAAWQLRKRAWIAVGWCWYLGMLVPVLGILQVGGQSMADRYTYLPLIGIFIIFAWAAGEATLALGRRGPAVVVLIGAAVLVLGGVAFGQVRLWSDPAVLFEHTASVTEDNWVAYDILGTLAYQGGDRSKAARDYLESIRLNPQYADAHFHIGLLFADEGDHGNAVAAFQHAIDLSPGVPAFHNALGKALDLLGRRDEAVAQYLEALRLDPGYGLAEENLRAARTRHP
ncbi:MAG TPA: tetratricopeptide repeat protein, partial [Anaeromyxobacteraceae bacterium]|nr:tetratricopeptide repeat protein [Anaeromyxobacteraceae bacterium]